MDSTTSLTQDPQSPVQIKQKIVDNQSETVPTEFKRIAGNLQKC